ncbi:ABC transporter substrate-binding protein [uncultured Amnibacterium sp.]|uniref:ABC transporter substrate-binding protein n=1 Tax=uncultured Amnibacterium sp. TaxID=1631851 RepID=UPI0035CA65C9
MQHSTSLHSGLTRRSALRLGGTVALGASTAALLAACSPGSASGGVAGSGTLTFMNRWSDPISKKNADALFAAFTKSTGIKVKNQTQPNSGDTYQPAVRNAYSSSNPPSLATDISGPEVYNLAAAGVLADLTSLTKGKLASRVQAGATAGSVLNGKVWGLSAGASVGNCVWVNQDYLKKYKISLSDITDTTSWIAAMQEIKKAGGTPLVIGAKDQWPGGHYLNDLVQRRLGSTGATELYNRTVVKGAADAIKWTDDDVVGSFDDYLAFKPLFQQGFLGEAAATADSAFLGGKAAFYEMGSWFLSTIRQSKPSFDIGVVLFPPVSGGKGNSKEVTLANETIIASPKAAKDDIADFFEYFTRPATLASWAGAQFKTIPYNYDTSAVKVDDPVLKTLFADVNGFSADAGPDGAALFNDQAIDVNIYTKYIWQGSVGLMSGDVAPDQLAKQLEDATVAAQEKLS